MSRLRAGGLRPIRNSGTSFAQNSAYKHGLAASQITERFDNGERSGCTIFGCNEPPTPPGNPDGSLRIKSYLQRDSWRVVFPSCKRYAWLFHTCGYDAFDALTISVT